MTKHGRAYRRLLRLYPARFRDAYADEMTRLFEDQIRDARRRGRPMAVTIVWLRSLSDLVATAAVTRVREAVHLRQPAGPASYEALAVSVAGGRARVVMALIPIWLLLGVLALMPEFFAPVFDNPPGIAGMPAGTVLLLAMVLWALVGASVIRTRRSDLGVLLTLLLFAIPASIVVILGPALVLFAQNLG